LANPKNCGAHSNLQKPGCLSIGIRGIHFFVGMADLKPIVALKYGEQRDSVQPGFGQACELVSRKVTGLEGTRLISAQPQAFDLNQLTCGRQRESRCNLLLRMNDAEREHS